MEPRVTGTVLSHPDQYDGERDVVVTTDPGLSDYKNRKAREAWAEFFADPWPLRSLGFVGQVTPLVFDSLAAQTGLVRLEITWGRYSALHVLEGMTKLRHLWLGGATAVTDLSPLTRLTSLRELHIDGAKRVTDYSPLGDLVALERLSVWGSANGGPRYDADSIAFLPRLTKLRELRWNPRVLSGDYAPLLEMTHVEEIALRGVRGMKPSMVDLEWALPGLAKWLREEREHVAVGFSTDGTVEYLWTDITGRTRITAEPPSHYVPNPDGPPPIDPLLDDE
ncbi:UNVERIFIED_CONTAM: hypothetical protein LK11_18060 [Mumia flava]